MAPGRTIARRFRCDFTALGRIYIGDLGISTRHLGISENGWADAGVDEKHGAVSTPSTLAPDSELVWGS